MSQSLYDWCMENGEWGKQLLYEFGDGNNTQEFTNELNIKQTPKAFARGSHTEIKWTCKIHGHTWEAVISNRVKNKTKCPYCSGRKASEENNLLTWCEQNGAWGQQLISEWTNLDENNKPVKMTDVTSGSNKKVRWRCEKQHEWVTDIHHRTSKYRRGCPVCVSQIIVANINDLKTWCLENEEYRHLIDEWTNLDENNNKIEMTEVARATPKKVKWKCSKGHEWIATVNSRTNKNKQGCPICATLRCAEIKATPVIGENDLLTWCNNNKERGEKLKSEWTGLDEQDNKIEMTEVARASHMRVKWKCIKGHEWVSSISHRTSIQYKRDCPYCSTIGTSYPEQFLYRSLKQLYPNTINRSKFNNIEYDIMITDTTPHVYIEYSAINWHINKLDRDELKASICKENNIRFIQIYAHSGQIEIDEDIFNENQIIYKASNNKEEHNKQLTKILQHVLNSLGHDISEINIEQAQTDAFNFMHDIEEADEELDDF